MSPVQKPERVRESANPQEVNALRRSGLWAADDGSRGCFTKRCLKNDDQSQYVHENKGNIDTMPDEKSDIYVDLTRLLQKTRLCDRQNAQEFS